MNTLEGVISRIGLLHLAFNQDQGKQSIHKAFYVWFSGRMRKPFYPFVSGDRSIWKSTSFNRFDFDKEAGLNYSWFNLMLISLTSLEDCRWDRSFC